MKLGENDIKLYLGSAEVDKVYLGTTQVYPSEEPTPVPYEEQYFTIESLDDDNNISFTMGTGMTTAITTSVTSVSVSTDNGSTWEEMQNIGAGASLSVTLDAGQKAIWKGEAVRYAVAHDGSRQDKQTRFSSRGQFKVYGNIMSLLSGDAFEDAETLTEVLTFCALFKECTGLTSVENLILPATTLTQNCYRSMFNGCTSLTSVENLILPATTLAGYCYSFMFQGCTSLTVAPELPAETLASSCYSKMFLGCTSLTTAPELPATTLTQSCYYSMFSGCTSLTTAPELPATTLTTDCYTIMFDDCTSLNYIKCLATDISSVGYTSNWVRGVASTGTFVKAASMSSWTTGNDGIPNGWTVQNDDGSLVGGGDIDPGYGGPDDGGGE